MGFVIVKKAKQATDYAKLRWLLLNPLSKSVIAELVERKNGKFKADELLEYYPKKPPSISWVSFQACKRILELLKTGLGAGDDFIPALRRPDIRNTILNTLLSIHTYGLKQPQRFYAPLMVVWNLTWRCNLRCKHCYENAGLLGGKKGAEELSLDEKLAVVDQLADSFIPTLSISGGEPLIHPHFWPVAERARARGLYMSLNTNGTLITDEVAARLEELDFAYAGISIDAPTREIHDSFRGVPGSWDKTIAGVKRLAKTSVCTILSFTITSQNYKTLPDIFKLAEDLGMDKVMVYNFIPTGRGRENMDLDLTPEQREEALEMMFKYASDGGSLCATAPQFGRMCSELGHPELIPLAHTGPGRAATLGILAQVIGGCGVGRAYLALQPDGRVSPCVYMPDVEIGRLPRDNVLDIWHTSDLLASLADHEGLKGHCGVCDYKAVCGGCRARAYGYFGDFKGPDPGCVKNKGYFYALQRCAETCPAERHVGVGQTTA